MSQNTPFRPCPVCGSNLDPGEHCDCHKQHDSAQAAGEYADNPTINPPLPVLNPGA